MPDASLSRSVGLTSRVGDVVVTPPVRPTWLVRPRRLSSRVEALDETEAIEVDDAVIETTDETVDETDDEATEEATDEATDAEVEAADESVVADEAPSDEAADEDETQEKSK